jgi:hypothetical protein
MRFRKRFYIHSIQRKYALLTFLLLASYTLGRLNRLKRRESCLEEENLDMINQ